MVTFFIASDFFQFDLQFSIVHFIYYSFKHFVNYSLKQYVEGIMYISQLPSDPHEILHRVGLGSKLNPIVLKYVNLRF